MADYIPKLMKQGAEITSPTVIAKVLLTEQNIKNKDDARNVYEIYDPTKSYVLNNKVILEYNGTHSSYINILPCKAVSPTYNTDNLNWKCISSSGGNISTATQLQITDTDNYFTSEDVNGALQQIGATTASHTTTLTDHASLLATIANKTPFLSIDQYDSYKVAVTDGYDYAPCLTQLISDLPSNGGTALIPNKEYTFFSDVTVNKTITILGLGYSSVIKSDHSIITDNDITHKLTVANIKMVNTITNTLLKIYKTYNEGTIASFELNNVWFYSESGSGVLLEAYATRQCGITNCWFTCDSMIDVIGINLIGNDTGGVGNILISQNKFAGLYTHIQAKGAKNENYTKLCGIKLEDNFIIGGVNGIIAEYVDNFNIEHNMVDWVRKPISGDFVYNFKIRNNYISSSAEYTYDAIDIVNSYTVDMRYLDISNNFISTYSETPGSGISLSATVGNIIYEKIHHNTITHFAIGVVMTSASETVRCLHNDISENICYDCTTFASMGTNVVLNTIKNNIADANVTNFIIDNGSENNKSVGNEHGAKKSNARGAKSFSGDGTTTVFTVAHGLLSAPTWGQVSLNKPIGIDYIVDFDATNIIVTFETAPPVGTYNTRFFWEAQI